MTRTTSAAVGVVAVVTAYVVERHYLQVEWVIDAPVPVLWWRIGAVLGVLGMPLLLTALGRWAGPEVPRLTGPPADRPWRPLLTGWVLPFLAAHLLWLGATLALLRRFDPGLTGIPARDVAEIVPLVLLPPPELSLLWSLALAPVVARLGRRLPTGAVVALLAGLTLLTPAPTFLVFLLIGLRLAPVLDGLAETATWRDLLLRGAVALVGASVLGVPRFPDGLAVVVAGLAVLPFALTLVALAAAVRAGPRRRARIGGAAVAVYLLQIPVVALFDRLLLARLGQTGRDLQYPAALVEPLVVTAAVVVCGVITTAVVRRAVHRVEPRRGGPVLPATEPPRVLAEVDR